MEFANFLFPSVNDLLKQQAHEQQQFKVTFTKQVVRTPAIAPDALPSSTRKALDRLAGLVFSPHNYQTILMGYDKSGKTFLLDQLVLNSGYYSKRSNLGPIHFITLTDVDMMELENTSNLKLLASQLMKNLACREHNICFVTDSPEIALYVASVLPLCRVVLKLTTGTNSAMTNPSAALSKVWQTWLQFDTISFFLATPKDLVETLWVTMAAHLNKSYPCKLTHKQVENFVAYGLRLMPEAVEKDSEGTEVVIVPPGVWATVLSALVTTMVYTSDENLLTPKGKVSFTKALKATFEEMSPLFGDLDPFTDDNPALSDLGGLPQDFLNIMEAAGVGRVVVMTGDQRGQEKQEKATPLRFKATATLAHRLEATVMGQEEAVTQVADSLMVPAAGLQDPQKPLRSFLFLGPTGVGKTQLALDLAKEVAEEELPVVRVDMSEYQMSHEVAKLFGAPPGYLGSDHGGVLTNAVLAHPKCVILLDEIEKAHPKVWDSFLQILDSGRMTDSSGQVVDFTQTIIIMTSNIGAQEAAKRKAGFSSLAASLPKDAVREKHSIVMKELEQVARPEFLNRIDDILVFQPLTKEIAGKIVEREIALVTERMKAQGRELHWESNKIVDLILEQADISRYGAREIQRIVFKQVSTPVAKFMVANTGKKTLTISTSPTSTIVVS